MSDSVRDRASSSTGMSRTRGSARCASTKPEKKDHVEIAVLFTVGGAVGYEPA